MIWQVIIKTPAQIDIDEAYVWYEEQSNGLGFQFIQQLDETIIKILGNPYFASTVFATVRSTSLSVFPYEVLYFIDEAKRYCLCIGGRTFTQPG